MENITECFYSAASLTLYVDGSALKIEKNDDNFEKIMASLGEITFGSHEMPAFGVSLDELTRQDMQSGIWLELEFDKTYSMSGMGFDALLIKVESEHSGFNLIRRNGGKYEGRCFYLSLENTMKELDDCIKGIIKA